MKKLLFSLSLVGALAAFAGESEIDASAQTFGVMTVNSTATDVIVSVPWVVATNDDATTTIPVADIVKTANLTEDDWIRVWDRSTKKFKVWNLETVDGVLTWVAGGTVDSSGLNQGVEAVSANLQRGDALILHRQHPGVFYLYGQYVEIGSSGIDTVCYEGSSASPVYTLIAPPRTGDTDLNDADQVVWTGTIQAGQSTGDQIIVGQSGNVLKRYYYDSTEKKWGVMKGTGFKAMPAVTAGMGLWYVSRGGSPTITWKK